MYLYVLANYKKNNLIKLPEKRVEYLNKESLRIVSEMKELPLPKNKPSIIKGSAKEKKVDDWTHKVVDAPVRTSNVLITGERVDWKECYEGKCYGFDKVLYPEFLKLVKTVEREKTINSIVSHKFLLSKSFDWFVKAYKDKEYSINYTDFIVNEIENSVQEYLIQFPVLYLEIEGNINIGKTKIGYYTKENLEQLEKQYLFRYPDRKDDNTYKVIKKHLQGEVFIAYVVKAEKRKAKQIAFEECSLAIDALKLCSITTEIPNYKISFDIDSRTKENLSNKVIYSEISKPDALIFDFFRKPNEYKIDKKEWQLMQRRQLKDFHEFLLKKDEISSELSRLIVNSIKKYASAISNFNLHQRVVDLFTIMESLLLKDDNSPIIDSLCKYGSKLVFKKIEDRKYAITLLKKMYSIRSAMVHHAKRKEIDLIELKRLQLIVIILLTQLIKKLDTHSTKNSILLEIDEQILKAY